MRSLLVLLFICSQQLFAQDFIFNEVKIDSNYSFRGLSVVDDSVAWLGGSKGSVGTSIDGGRTWKFNIVKGFEKFEFRSIYAFDAKCAIVANAGSPACILRTIDGGKNWTEVYRNTDSLAFFDGIDFWNPTTGIIYGDPIDGKMLMLVTYDRGLTWQAEKYPPHVEQGEASFAASGTNIRFMGSHVYIATGGKESRIIHRNQDGIFWHYIKPPILKGADSQGIFSMAILNRKKIIIVGGDYLKEAQTEKHVFFTSNGGKKWQFPKTATSGYRECVEYINKNTVIAVGPSGSDISLNGGKNWKPLSHGTNLHVIRKARKGSLIIAAGRQKIAILKY
jgi:photosystem II stability/assembly factor-like uncharacterized protein